MLRIQEKSTLLAAARLVLKELPAGMGTRVCEERYAAEVDLCKAGTDTRSHFSST